MIIVKNRKMLIPAGERLIGTDYDSNSEQRVFRIDRYTQTETDLSGLSAKVDVYDTEGKVTDRIIPVVETDDEYIYLTVTFPGGYSAGTKLIDVKFNNIDGQVKWATYKGAFVVDGAIDIDQKNLTELEQLEERINEAYELASKATVDANAAASTVNGVVTNCQNASIDAREAASNAEAIAADLTARIASGEFIGAKGDTGPQGPQGESGIVSTAAGFFALWVDNDGNLWCDYSDEGEPPSFTYNSTSGNLYFNF